MNNPFYKYAVLIVLFLITLIRVILLRETADNISDVTFLLYTVLVGGIIGSVMYDLYIFIKRTKL